MISKVTSMKTVGESIPSPRFFLHIVTRTKFLVLVMMSALMLVTWRGLRTSAAALEKYYCYGPAKSPMELTANEMASWLHRQNTPVIFNKHEPLEYNLSTVHNIKLNDVKSTKQALANKERLLMLTPLKDAAYYLPKYFELIMQITYPHDLIDIGFLVGDTEDETMAALGTEIDRMQNNPNPGIPFRSVTIVEKDFGQLPNVTQDVDSRHGWAAQGPRRRMMGKARNYLLYSTMKQEHSWVYWRDVDIVDIPSSIIEDFIAHDRDILVPNVWFHRYDNDNKDIEGRFDYNSWRETEESRKVMAGVAQDRDLVVAEGYREIKTGREYMALQGDWRNNKDEEIELDGIGGVNILVKAEVHRAGINFPSYAFENQAETEGFAKMAKRAGYQVIGLPNYIVWHIDTQETPGNDKDLPLPEGETPTPAASASASAAPAEENEEEKKEETKEEKNEEKQNA